ncbi:MAG: hypothetical protein ABSE07_02320 [Methanoregula sp.]
MTDGRPDGCICFGMMVVGLHGPNNELPMCLGSTCSDYPACSAHRIRSIHLIEEHGRLTRQKPHLHRGHLMGADQ